MAEASYSFSGLHVTGHKLQYYDPGYGLASIFDLTCKNPNSIDYQRRRVTQELINLLNTHKGHTASIFVDDGFLNILPFVLFFAVPNQSRIAYFLVNKNINVRGVRLNFEIGATIRNDISSDPDHLFRNFVNFKTDFCFYISSNPNLETQTNNLVALKRITSSKRAFILDAAKVGVPDIYFYCRKNSLQVCQHSDFSATITFPEG